MFFFIYSCVSLFLFPSQLSHPAFSSLFPIIHPFFPTSLSFIFPNIPPFHPCSYPFLLCSSPSLSSHLFPIFPLLSISSPDSKTYKKIPTTRRITALSTKSHTLPRNMGATANKGGATVVKGRSGEPRHPSTPPALRRQGSTGHVSLFCHLLSCTLCFILFLYLLSFVSVCVLASFFLLFSLSFFFLIFLVFLFDTSLSVISF